MRYPKAKDLWRCQLPYPSNNPREKEHKQLEEKLLRYQLVTSSFKLLNVDVQKTRSRDEWLHGLDFHWLFEKLIHAKSQAQTGTFPFDIEPFCHGK
jgi:hypothetical protein